MRLRKHLLTVFPSRPRRDAGSSLIEVLVTMVILAVGLLGLAGMQSRIHLLELESFGRGQAVVMLNDIVDRISADRDNFASYVGNVGTGATCASGGTGVCNCSAVAAGAAKELCEWSNLVKGAAEKSASNPIGGVASARACIATFTRVPTGAAPAIYGMCETGLQIDLVWQGTNATSIPGVACGAGVFGTNDAFRRAISSRIVTGVTAC